MDDLMPIGEFSERSGLSQKRLRAYAAAGLLAPAAVDSDTGYRYYAPGQLRDARLVDALRRADIPLSAIATALHDPSAFDATHWCRQLDDESRARRTALDEALDLFQLGADRPSRMKETPMTTLTAAARTETGPSRPINQDVAIVGDRLVGVADGMGGTPGGEIASSLAATVVLAGFGGASAGELAAVTRSANAAIFDRGAADSALTGMGTTLCCAGLVDDGSVVVVNVGDSRAYVLHDGELRQVTDDHSVTAEMVRQGLLEEPDASRHPLRHVLTRVLGVLPTVEAGVAIIDLAAEDLLLLCTDGLSKALTNDDIARLLSLGGGPSELADRLVAGAIGAGTDDDVTVVVAQASRPPR